MKIKTVDIFNGEENQDVITMDFLIDIEGTLQDFRGAISVKELVKLDYHSRRCDFYLGQEEDGQHTIYLKKK
jgi:hypothetical protein